MSLFDGTNAHPRDYQSRICSKVLSMFDGTWVAKDGSTPDPAKSVMIDSPTGSGKTIMGLAIAQHAHRLGKTIGWVAMRRNLLKQAVDSRDRLGFDVPGMRTISMFDRDPPKVDWLVVDECHHDATDSMANIHDKIRPEKVIGLSGTPYRTDRTQLAFERVVRDVGINSLIMDGWLSKYDHYTIRNYTPKSVASLFSEHPGRWGRSVVFFRTMAECSEASRLLAAAGEPNEIVWGGSDKERQIDDYREGKVNTLVSMSILAEGFDVDDMKTVFIRPSGRLTSVQMGGRVLRTCPSTPIKQIVQCQDTRYPFLRTAASHNSYVLHEGRWLALRAEENVDAVVNEWTKKILASDSVLPKFLSDRKKRNGFSGPNTTDSPGNSDPSDVI